MSDRTPCKECDASILLSTSERTGGFCMPCKNGYRKNIEESKKYYAKEKELNEICPFRALWRELMDKVYNKESGFNGLSDKEKLYYTVSVFCSEIYNGGFIQYFDNSSGEHYLYAEKGLINLNAVYSLKLLHQAKEELFGKDNVPTDRTKRCNYTQQSVVGLKLNELDTEFYKDLDDLDNKLEVFAIHANLVQNV